MSDPRSKPPVAAVVISVSPVAIREAARTKAVGMEA